MITATFSQLFMVSVLHKTRLKIHTEIHPSGQILHAFSVQRNFILLVRTVAFSQKILFNSSYTKENNYFLLYELIQDLPYVNYVQRIITLNFLC